MPTETGHGTGTTDDKTIVPAQTACHDPPGTGTAAKRRNTTDASRYMG